MASHAYSGTNGYGLPSYNREPQQPASVADGAQQIYERVARYNNGPGQAMAWRLARRVIACLRVNLAPRRLLSIPHLLVAMWMVVMLWGERWKFTGSVQSCDWDHWEKWVSLRPSAPPLPQLQSVPAPHKLTARRSLREPRLTT